MKIEKRGDLLIIEDGFISPKYEIVIADFDIQYPRRKFSS